MIYSIAVKDGGYMETTNSLIAASRIIDLMNRPGELTITVREEPREE